MVGFDDIVITGLGCVTPLGIGHEELRKSLLNGQCAVRRLVELDDEQRTTFCGATIDGYEGKQYVTPRKALKVMSREVQIAYTAAQLAWQDAELDQCEQLDADRMGVVYGSEMIPGDLQDLSGAVQACIDDGEVDISRWGREALREIFPLWMLKNLPNMPACHVGIAVDARGPNNTIVQEEVGSLLALQEAAGVIQRGQADLMIVGGFGSRVTPTRQSYRVRELYCQHPADVLPADLPLSQPFGVRRSGIIASEAGVAIIIERRSHAVARGATILGRLCGISSRCAQPNKPLAGSGKALAAAATQALRDAGLEATDLNHICAQGFSEAYLDVSESQAIQDVAREVPVTAYSSYFGTVGAASALTELVASLTSVLEGHTLPTLGTQEIDANCKVNLCREIKPARTPHFLKLSFNPFGHAAAAVIECEI